jgi:predicted Rossmann fold nucleotide-binding protein DprA/Smf involved in DNA uptake
MNLTPQAQAVMLLTVSFGKSDQTTAKPLSRKEWSRFAIWLRDHSLGPASLFENNLQSLLAGWVDRTVSVARLEQLMGRGTALGLSLEKWHRAGLWILTRSDPDYPEKLKRRLGSGAPAVLFGCGNRRLLSGGGVAVVGSRDASREDLAFTKKLGEDAAKQGYSIVSGGARGVDQTAMLGALDKEGTSVGVLADSLLKSVTSSKYRKHIMSGDLALITPFNPEAGFNVGNAMSRNRYIYCLADAAVVVSSTPEKGGTWNGAIEGLKAKWVPLWVRQNTNEKSGNSELHRRGAELFPETSASLATLLNGAQPSLSKEAPNDLLTLKPEGDGPIASEPEEHAVAVPGPREETIEVLPKCVSSVEPGTGIGRLQVDLDFYGLFLIRMLEITTATPLKPDEIAELLELGKTQTQTWIKRGVGEGKIVRFQKPVRYQSAKSSGQQALSFEDDGG